MTTEYLQTIIDTLPNSPGVYIMKDKDSHCLYIGKATRLRSRVRSYFRDSCSDRLQIPYMIQKVTHIEWIATNTPSEALILEENLVRIHKPHYNIDLKDDKHFPYLKLTLYEPFPRLIVVRRVLSDNALYFGPYTDTGHMHNLLQLIQTLFRLRQCTKRLPLHKPARPCINYSMNKCCGACASLITQELYNKNITSVIQILKGRYSEVLGTLQSQMQQYSDQLEFEQASVLRDQIKLLKQSHITQKVDLLSPDSDIDAFGISQTLHNICLCVLSFRKGILISKDHFVFPKTKWNIACEDFDSFILQFYTKKNEYPPQTLLLPNTLVFNNTLVKEWLESKFQKKIALQQPEKGEKTHLIHLAEKNASLFLNQNPATENNEIPLELSKEILGLMRIPLTIEAFDISNIGSHFAVAGMVHFHKGIPDKSQYRRFKIRTIQNQNDFAMLMEAVSRRLTRLQQEEKPFPDLLVIDGGEGQLHSVLRTLTEFQEPPMVIALSKKMEIIHSPYVPHPVILTAHDPVRKLLQRIRDEVHRYSHTYHTTIRDKQYRHSTLEQFSYIGPKRAALLLRTFGSLSRLKQASVEQIAQVNGFSISKAEQLFLDLQKIQPSKKTTDSIISPPDHFDGESTL